MSTTDQAIIVGAGGGLGRALTTALAARFPAVTVHALSRRGEAPAAANIVAHRCDPTDDESLAAAFAAIDGPVTRMIVTTGMLHDAQQQPEKSWRSLDRTALSRSFAINTIAPLLAVKAALPKLPRNAPARIAVLGARVGSISDNRLGGWLGYRASKAALVMGVRTLAIELARTHPQLVCVALHPGTVDTPMSEPFSARTPPEKRFTPDYSACCLLDVLEALTPAQSGGHFAWDGSPVPA